MIDIGVNLTNSRFDKDREAVIARSQQAGVKALILTGTSENESLQALAMAHQWPGYCFSTAGVHPHDAKSVSDFSLPVIRELAADPAVVAVGECGLDFNRDFSPRPQQEAVFEAQLALAAELQKPVFMHCRDAHDRFLAILKPWRDKLPAAVLHCFTGSEQELKDCLALDLHIGITGWICDERRGTGLRNIVRHIPDNRLMIETDCPYLLPRDLRPKPKSSRNEPAYLPHIAQAVAACRQQSADDLMAAVSATSRAFFQIEPA
ncbi:3'-5' ssDNA/RNA exonuclease TatD [Photobacterium halotolerans]|uniref:3'-5' ssDNA/RNA exonuclease TatD n=1 Tax=Photobacterium halotolerans TaxID=265726 RepID=A0A7X5BL59_9GAMM|nr:3'-5' ssDNA/RNA exonuclease TatD [Photobacterium halotolerans]NAW66391.1 3'-5' ssDNA/RNA exonuclease TatD [Photobacterium halotolerans]NAX47299.1 3'-5' ssDNA/RNA exonuclease TatD [Photobacterium halotolerans]